MCGIFAYIGKDHSTELIKTQFTLGKSRGPESSVFITPDEGVYLGFHRLAINGLSDESNQPFDINGIYLICNGEIYYYSQLYKELDTTPVTYSDCEVIIHLYLKYGIDYLLDKLDGVFSFVLYDSNQNIIYVARDPYGVRPLYYIQSKYLAFASELKQLNEFEGTIRHFKPGTYGKITFDTNSSFSSLSIPINIYKMFNVIYSKPILKLIKYSSFGFSNNETELNVSKDIYNNLLSAVKKRVIGTTERPIACLLSGGLDSSTITALVNSFLPKGVLETYSIGMENSTDLYYARKVANHLGTKHTEIILSENEFFESIPEVIKAIESYDTTTVRASVGNYLIGKYIKQHSDAKVIFNGDGADELMGGYRYFNKNKDHLEFDNECRRLLRDIHLFDVLRSDKCISSHGLEPRTPFLDRKFVQYYLSIPSTLRCHTINNKCEKYLLRNAINEMNPGLLPPEVLFRTKEAFSDGVSSLDRSWYEIIHEKLTYELGPGVGIDLEKKYYLDIFDKEYQGRSDIVPYYWMPKYLVASDPSARIIN